ncbi:MAG: alcohol dehydrogenase catalytic domain-containing protein [Halobacteriaceae archaeon]
MRAVVLDEWGGSLSVENRSTPDPGPGEALVDVRACGVTRTIENAIQGGLADDESLTPRVPGHEFAGVVEAVGERVTAVAPGDRVMAYFYLTCGECDACRRGETAQCTNFGGWFGVHRDGAYAEQTVVPAENLLPLPDAADFTAGAIATDGLATPLHVCERAGIDDSDTVLVIGAAGRIGVHLSQLAALRGAHVIAADVTRARLDHVDEHTPAHVEPIDASEDDLAERLQAATPYGEGPTVVVDTVGDTTTLSEAWAAMGMGGQVVSLTTHHERVLERPLRDYVVSEAALLGSRYATKDQVVRAARLLADGRIDPVVTEQLTLASVPDRHRALRAGETHGMAVLEP